MADLDPDSGHRWSWSSWTCLWLFCDQSTYLQLILGYLRISLDQREH